MRKYLEVWTTILSLSYGLQEYYVVGSCVCSSNKRTVYVSSDRASYTPEELILYIEQQFEPGMTWDNYGTAWASGKLQEFKSDMNWSGFK